MLFLFLSLSVAAMAEETAVAVTVVASAEVAKDEETAAAAMAEARAAGVRAAARLAEATAAASKMLEVRADIEGSTRFHETRERYETTHAQPNFTISRKHGGMLPCLMETRATASAASRVHSDPAHQRAGRDDESARPL